MSLQFNISAANQPAQLPSPMDRLKAILGTQAQYAGIQGDQASTAGQLLQNTQTQNTITAQQKKLQDDEAYKQQASQIFQKHNGDVEGALTEMLSLPQTQASQDHVTAITNTLDKVQRQKAASLAAQQKLETDKETAVEKKTVWQQQQDEIKARNDYWAAQLAAGVPDLPENRKKAMADYDAIGKPPDLMNSPLTDNVIDKRNGQVVVKGQAAPHNIDPNSPEGIAAAVAKSQQGYHAPAVQLVQTTDDQGNKVQKFVPKVAGDAMAAAPTAQEQNRRNQASTVSQDADRIIAMIERNPNAVGPILGRLARGEAVMGIVSPEAKQLATALGSFEALQPILHGFRGGGQTMDHFHSVIGDQRLNAEALKASIREIKTLAEGIKTGKIEVDDSGTPARAQGNFSVTDPNGKVHPFATKAEADRFKSLAGIK